MLHAGWLLQRTGALSLPWHQLTVVTILFAVGFLVNGLFMEDWVFYGLAILYGVLAFRLMTAWPSRGFPLSLLHRYIVPFSFLLMGGYLEWLRVRRERYGS